MIALPPDLTPWRRALSLFPPDLALGLGRLVARFSRAFGPIFSSAPARRGDPDGYDGLARRGSYERLLISEWLLASEAPEEFARRAAMGEHAFLAPAFREPTGTRRSLALFDAGPSSLGTPRIAHLAALIALDARAEAGGAPFAWGVLQDERRAQIAELSHASIRRLLVERSAREVDEPTLRAWIEDAGLDRPDGGATDDLWLIGTRRLGAIAPDLELSLAEIEDVLAPTVRRVRVALWRGRAERARARAPRGARATVDLEVDLPAADACVRLLRDPFQVIVRDRRVMRADGGYKTGAGLFFCAGRRLMLQLGSDTAGSFPIPNSAHAPIGRPTVRRIPESETLIAAGWHQQRMLLVSGDGGELVLRETGVRGGDARKPARFSPAADGPPLSFAGRLLPCFRLAASESKVVDREAPGCDWTVLVDAEQRLFQLPHDRSGRFLRSNEGITSITKIGSRVVLVADSFKWERARRRVELLGPQAANDVLGIELGPGDGDLEAFFGYGSGWAHPVVALLAARTHRDRWRVISGPGAIDLVPPRSTVVVGVARNRRQGPGGEPALLVLEEDRRTLTLLGRSASRQVVHAPHPIEAVAVNPWAPLIAYAMESREVVVYNLDHDVPLLTIQPGQIDRTWGDPVRAGAEVGP